MKLTKMTCKKSSDSQQQGRYREQGRPYLVSAGVENGIKYAFAMSPLMSEMLSTAEFLQTDITYNENSQYPYLFNVVVFSDITMEWMHGCCKDMVEYSK